jgi:hypothetical protein
MRDLSIGAAIVIIVNMLFFLVTLTVNSVVSHSTLRARLVHFVTTGQITKDNWPLDFTGNKLDRYSDCTGVSLNLVGPVDRSPLQLLIDSDIVGIDELGRDACEVLATLSAEGNTTIPIYKYFRYWHGYQILTKPILEYLEFSEFRRIVSVIYILTVFTFCFITVRSSGRILTAVLLSLSFILLTNAENLDGVLVHNLALITTFLGGIGLYQIAARGSLRSVFFVGLAIAAFISFIDENYVPPLAAMVLSFAALSAKGHSRQADTYTLANTFGVVLFAWACGYLGTMVLRVVVSVLLLPDGSQGLYDFMSQFWLRVSGEVPWEVRSGIFAPILRNLEIVALNPFLPAVVVCAAALVLERVVRGWKFRLNHVAVFYLFVAALPFPWYISFWQYSVIHNHIFYRWAAFSLVCFLATVLLSFYPSKSGSAQRSRWHVAPTVVSK